MIKLVNDTINNTDIDHLIDWLKTYPRLTKGPLTVELEKKWSKWLGVDNSIFCNSGSSANLLMLWALVEANRINKDAKVVVPSAAWATDLSPVIQLGMTPILCDINLKNLSVDLNHLETIFKETKPEVLLLVSVLGLVPDMQKINELCNKYNVILLEDTCESMGSKWENKKLGTFGLMSSFSTYFGHHIDSSPEYSKQLRNQWETSNFDALYTFYHSGFNLRSTDLQAFIGLGQIDKLDDICKKRNKNFKIYQQELSSIRPYINECSQNFISNFAYPVISENRDSIVAVLQKENIEVTQPFYVKEYGKKELPNASIIDKWGFYIPNHPGLSKKDIIKISNIIRETDKLIDPYLQTK